WDSWADGAMVHDKATAQCFDPAKVRILNHSGKHFRVRGPLNVLRSPQGRPIVVQAGASGPGKALAARIADCVFSAQSTIPSAREFSGEIRSSAVGFGRRPEDLKIMPGIIPVLGRSDGEAQELLEELRANITDEQALRSLYRLSAGLDLRKLPLDG